MTLAKFIEKWQSAALTEKAGYQEHFRDLCDLFGHPRPSDADPSGTWFTFEKGVTTTDGKQGYADVWHKGKFAWEYKGKHKNLDAAYQQLLRYREALENPPVLVVCDFNRFVVHTNFTSYAKKEYRLTLADLTDPEKRNWLRLAFTDPEQLRPDKTQEQLTREVADRFGALADGMRGRGVEPHRAAHFLMQLVFCMFAEDIDLLRKGLFTQTVATARKDPDKLSGRLDRLFREMATGGSFGPEDIDHFNGGLFEAVDVVPLTPAEIEVLHHCAGFDWGSVEPSIFGTLFERILDPGKRAQLGAHYTSREDIETLLRPVFLDPLRREWEAVRAEADMLWAKVEAAKQKARPRGTFENHVNRFLDRLDHVTVLDPACGSGNFLYVALSMLLDLEKEVRSYLSAKTGQMTAPAFQPTHLMGLEVNAYARELAQVVIWIGYLQWQHENGYPPGARPILPKLETIQRTDAVLDLSDPAAPREPQWPDAEFIVGNPPFLGGKMLRSNLGDEYVDVLFKLYDERVRSEADLCCYWFEKARAMIEAGRAKRAGLLATQGIRGGANRDSLARIKETGDIFFAVSDQEWVLDGAAVHISMVGFDDGTQKERTLDGKLVAVIHPNLTSGANVTQAHRLAEKLNVGFMGDTKGGSFDIPLAEAVKLFQTPNVNGRPSSDVVTPWCNGLDVTRRNRDVWIIDFGVGMPEQQASLYEAPFGYVQQHVYPERQKNKRDAYRLKWWIHVEARPGMRKLIEPLPRFLVTPNVTKHRLFVWMEAPTLADHQLIAFARSDDYFFGVLHSRMHEVWARSQGTQLREVESGFRYTPTTCFETFPFPEPTDGQREAVAAAAKELDRLRSNWLNPPEWVREEVLTFPGSADGPWRRYVDPATLTPTPTLPPQGGGSVGGVGTVRYPRLVPKDVAAAAELKKRTLTNLYNERPAWLAAAHRRLDEAVSAAYGWPADLSDDDLLARLLALNLSRAGAAAGEPAEE